MKENLAHESIQNLDNHNRENDVEKKAPEFNFKEIADLEPSFVTMVERMKEVIERGEYDTIISDDVGGRIPSLVLRKILKEKGPKDKLEIFFVSGGHALPGRKSIPGRYESEEELEHEYENILSLELIKHLKKYLKKTQKVLLVSEKTHHGKSLISLGMHLEEAGVKEFDIACVASSIGDFVERYLPGHKVYEGGCSMDDVGTLYEKRTELGGVIKNKNGYSPHPIGLLEYQNKFERYLNNEEIREIYGLDEHETPMEIIKKFNDPENIARHEKRKKEKLTPEEIDDVKRNIKKARKDVELLADRVIREVWGE